MQLEALATKLGLDRSQLIREAVAHYLKKISGECEACTFSEDPSRCTCAEVRETNTKRGRQQCPAVSAQPLPLDMGMVENGDFL